MIGDDELLTLEQALAMMPPLWEAIERTILEHVAAEVIAAGFAEADVRLAIEQRARLLRESRPGRLETAKQMLEHRCLAVH
jgi:hypothetical protein